MCPPFIFFWNHSRLASVCWVKREVMEMKLAAAGCLAGLAIATLTLAGCRVDATKDGEHQDVKIATPFGGMSVRTNDAVVQEGVGLSVYPGATLTKKKDDTDNDEGAADVNLSFGSFKLRVKALSYTTADSPEKVLAFYRKDMKRYGAVLLCQGKHPVGTPTVTQDGLTCSEDENNNIHAGDNDSDQELKAGSKLHQHIVGLDPQGSGTKIGLVALDLPGHLNIPKSDSQQ
jgi:hypothetical protein